VVGASAMKLRTFCGAPRSRSSRDRPYAAPILWIHHFNQLLGGHPLGPTALFGAAPSLRLAS
jgi:hypothetical protein